MEEESAETKSLLACATQKERQDLLAALFLKYRARLALALRVRLGSRLERRLSVSDILQETCLEAVHRIDEYLAQPRLPLYLWLRFLALQKFKTLRRYHEGARRRDVRREVSLEVRSATHSTTMVACPEDSQRSPTQAALRAERSELLREALRLMDPLDREVVLLRHFEGLSWSEGAQVLGIQVPALRQRHARALKKLREILRNSAQERSAYWRA